MKLRHSCVSLVIFAATAQADVHIVEPGGLGDFVSIQDAVNAASDGDTLLLRSGSHAAFTITDKSLNLVADFGAEAQLRGPVVVEGLAANRTVRFMGVTIAGEMEDDIGVSLTNNLGPVRFQSCMLLGYDGMFAEFGTNAVEVSDCADVAFAACTLEGGDGASNNDQCCSSTGSGASGLFATDSNVVLYDCTLIGGEGGTTGEGAGDGATACIVANGTLFSSGCSMSGGDGGDAFDFIFAVAGDGGHGIEVTGTGIASMLDTITDAGVAGAANFAGFAVPGVDGVPMAGNGTFDIVPGIARSVSAPHIARSNEIIVITASGAVGDDVFLPASATTGHVPSASEAGVWLTAFPPHDTKPVGTIGASGTSQFFTTAGRVMTNPAQLDFFGGAVASIAQGHFDSGAGFFLGSPVSVFIVDCAKLGPDCNANGRFDSCDVVLGSSNDCQENGVPDECESDCNSNGIPDFCDPAFAGETDCDLNGVPDSCDPDCDGDTIPDGCEPDCNANGVPDDCDFLNGTSDDCDSNGVPDDCQEDCNSNGVLDSCDLSMGTSIDLNVNLVPDECEPANLTWYVDANALAGGDGTLASPFVTIGDAVDVVLSGQRIEVAAGTYSGPDNRDFDFTGRAVDIYGASGPASTIIDLEDQGRFCHFIDANDGNPLRVADFTIRNGDVLAANGSPEPADEGGAIYVRNCAPTIENCIIRDCTARFGGAITSAQADTRIRNCTIRDGLATHSGGAIYIANGNPTVVGCVILNNTCALGGGGISASNGFNGVTRISHCAVLGNHAGISFTGVGGGIYATGHTSGIETTFIDNCLVEGNTGDRGSGIRCSNGARISNCTVVGNAATINGGGLHFNFDAMVHVVNTIVWNNSAPTAPQVLLGNLGDELFIEFSNIQGGQAGIVVDAGILTYAPSNIDTDPLFVDPDGPDDNPATLLGNNHRLGAGSPCVDAGLNLPTLQDSVDIDGDGNTAEVVPLDLNLFTRRVDDPAVADTGVGAAPVIDMGAHERQP